MPDGSAVIPLPALPVFEPVEKDHVMTQCNFAASCKIWESGHGSAKERMKRRFQRLMPSLPGDSVPRSLVRPSSTLVPYPSAASREERSWPMNR